MNGFCMTCLIGGGRHLPTCEDTILIVMPRPIDDRLSFTMAIERPEVHAELSARDARGYGGSMVAIVVGLPLTLMGIFRHDIAVAVWLWLGN